MHAMQLTLDIVGASSFMWRQQHVVGHHAYTNVIEVDPDIRCALRRIFVASMSINRTKTYHCYQHIYLVFAYGLLSLKSCFVDDFSALASGKIGWVKVAKFTKHEALTFWGCKLIWAFYYLYLPTMYGTHSASHAALLVIVTEFVTGWLLAFMFQVAHVVGDVRFFELTTQGSLKLGWENLNSTQAQTLLTEAGFGLISQGGSIIK